MINQKLLRQFASLAIAVSLFTSCSKVDKVEPMTDSGQTVVKFADGGTSGMKNSAIDFLNTPVALTPVELRRDVPNQAALNTNLVISIADDTAAVAAAGLKQLPADLYTIGEQTPKTGGAGGTYTVTFSAGEAAKQIQITITNPTLLNPALSYGLGFTIQSTDVKGVVITDRTIVLQVGAKSKLDGRYQLKGAHNRTSPLLTDPYNEEVYLITTGGNSVKMFWPALGVDAHPIHGGTTFYADFTTEFTFDLSTNKLTGVVNPYNPAATPFKIGPATTSRYDPSTKTIYAQYYYNNNTERMFTDTLVYLGSR